MPNSVETLGSGTHKTCEEKDWNLFFDGPQKKQRPKSPEIAPIPRSKNSFCARWVNAQSFEINRADDQEQSVISEHTDFDISQLSETVYCHQDQAKKPLRTKTKPKTKKTEHSTKRSRTLEQEPVKKRQKSTQATREIRESVNGNSKWKVVQGIHVELDTDSLQTSEGTPIKEPYDELMSLFQENVKINDGIHFEHSYAFDWDHFDKHGMQYVVFTKVCQSHEPGYFIEMRKEDMKCINCGGTDLALTIRLTIPLSLSEIPIPVDENLGIHVAFIASKLPNTSDSLNVDFSRETAEKMYKLYRKMVLVGKPSKEYTQWFQRCRRFVKNSLLSKRLCLFHGRVIRRKFEEVDRFTKRRCFVFADIFNFE